MVNYENYDSFLSDYTNKELIIYYEDEEITSEDIHSGSFSLEESICLESELRFGGCEASKIAFKILNKSISLKNKWLTVKLIINDDVSKAFQLGKYKVFSDKLTSDRRHREIVAYDRMYDISNTDVTEWYNGLIFPMSLKKFRDLLFEKLEVTQEDVELSSDDISLEKSEYSEKVFAGDILKDICEINAVFGRMSRSDTFEYVSLSPNVAQEMDKSNYSKSEYEDYSTQQITQVIFTGNESDYYYGDVGNTYILSPRVIEVKKDHLEKICSRFIEKTQNCVYIPFSIVTRGNPCLECGDYISFISGDNVVVRSYILERKFSGELKLSDEYIAQGNEYYEQNNGTNDNVAMQVKKGLAEVSKNSLYSLVMTNSEKYNLSDAEKEVIKYNIASTSQTNAILFVTIPFRANLDGVLKVNYYVDSELISNQTILSYFNEGNNVITLCNYFPMEENSRMVLTITLSIEYYESNLRRNNARLDAIEYYIDNGVKQEIIVDRVHANAIIEQETIRSVLIGKGIIVSEGWDGILNFADNFGTITVNPKIVDFNSNVYCEFKDPKRNVINEMFAALSIKPTVLEIADQIIVNEVVDNYVFSTANANKYEYDVDKVIIKDNSFTLADDVYLQNIISDAIDISHSSILGIDNVIVNCTENVAIAISTDKLSWKAYINDWVDISGDYSGMSKTQIESLTVDQWNKLLSEDVNKLYLRISLPDSTQSIRNLTIKFIN